jgi:MscS family membrane protein
MLLYRHLMAVRTHRLAAIIPILALMFEGGARTLLAMQVPLGATGSTTSSSAPATPASGAAAEDPLHRTSPQSTMLRFLEACRTGNYSLAARFLDLRDKSPEERAKVGPALAKQLQAILDHSSDFDLGQLSNSPTGDLSDGLAQGVDSIATFNVDKKEVALTLHRIVGKSGIQHWLVTPESVARIPELHALIVESPFERKLPSKLVTIKFLDTSLWQWIAYILLAVILVAVSRLLSYWLLAGINRLLSLFAKSKWITLGEFAKPIWLMLAISIYRAALEAIGGSALVRLFITRILMFLFFLGMAWLGADFVDVLASRVRSRLSARQRAVSYSVIPLFQRVAKIGLFAFALLVTLSHLGYNTNTLVAGLGVGGLAIALAAQKTLENLFGGVSVITDRPVLVGDFCKFGTQMGTVEDIGLRSTRIRTLDRTLVSVPNAQFSTMTLENFAARDRFWFHQTLLLRGDANMAQIRQVMSGIESLLRERPNIDAGKLPVLFTALGTYSFELQVSAYVKTVDGDEFNRTQTELLIRILEIVEGAGTGIAVPVQESFSPRDAASVPVQSPKAAEDGTRSK